METGITLYQKTANDLLMQATANGVSVPANEERLILSADGATVGQMADRELGQAVKMLLQGIYHMCGIRADITIADEATFFSFLQRWFHSFTLVDVKMAFEFYVVGELDRYLPKDKHGEPSHKHYQTFSAEFYTPILRAYRKRQQEAKMTVSSKVAVALLEAAPKPDPKEVRLGCIAIMREAAVALCEGGEARYMMNPTYMGILWEVGLLPESFEITDTDVATAKREFCRRKHHAVASSLAKVIEEGLIPQDIRTQAELTAVRREFRQCSEMMGREEVEKRFDELIQKVQNGSPD